jgi:hypothetical protein
MKKNQEVNTWKIFKWGLRFVRSNGNQDYYIENERLDEIRNEYEYYGVKLKNVSDWIDHLRKKQWIEKRHLLELAEIIKERKPKNKIDWDQTFWLIEVASALRNLHDLMEKNNEFPYPYIVDGKPVGRTGVELSKNGEIFEVAAINYLKKHSMMPNFMESSQK